MKRHLTPVGDVRGVPLWWRPLFDACGNTSIFLTDAWMQGWVESFGAGFAGEWVHWEDQGRVVGGCLLLERVVKVRGVSLRSVFLNATGIASTPTPLAEYNEVLHLPAFADAVLADLALLLGGRPWSRCFISGYGGESLCARLTAKLDAAGLDRESAGAPYIDLAALGERSFHESLTGSAGTQLRKNLRRYRGQLGAPKLRVAADLEEALAFFGLLASLNVSRWKAQGQRTTLESPTVIEFHRRLIQRLWDSGRVELLRADAADQALGYLYNFVVDGKVFFFQSGFDYTLDPARSPGIVTHALAIERYRRGGLREYDFMAGDERYKRCLANRRRELHWAVVHRNTLRMRAYLTARRLTRLRLGKAGATARRSN